jgi:E3 ubiquitin-protein ligase TRIP12
MMLLSSRAITHLLEVLPKVSPKVAACGAVRIFCQRLQTIEFIDVAEQSLMVSYH